MHRTRTLRGPLRRPSCYVGGTGKSKTRRDLSNPVAGARIPVVSRRISGRDLAPCSGAWPGARAAARKRRPSLWGNLSPFLRDPPSFLGEARPFWGEGGLFRGDPLPVGRGSVFFGRLCVFLGRDLVSFGRGVVFLGRLLSLFGRGSAFFGSPLVFLRRGLVHFGRGVVFLGRPLSPDLRIWRYLPSRITYASRRAGYSFGKAGRSGLDDGSPRRGEARCRGR